MRNILYPLILLLSMLLMQGCANEAKFAKRYNNWVGKNIAYFVAQQGYPDRTYTLPNHHKVYVYEESRIVSRPSFGFGYGRFDIGGIAIYDPIVEQEQCKLFIETNSKGKIVKWGSRGNACVSE